MVEHSVPDPLVSSNHENLFVIPYVHGRLMFAQAAAHAVQTLRPDIVAVDLPAFFEGSEFLETAVSAFPLATAFLVNHPAHEIRTLPFVVTDAGSLAAHRALTRGIPFACIGSGLAAEWPTCGEDVALPDDSTLRQLTFDAYFHRAWQCQASLPDRKSQQMGPAHAESMAYRLQCLLDAHRRVLFVCEWKRWFLVERMLGRAGPTGDEESFQAPVALIFEDPLQLWNCGYMDDFPALNLLLFKHVQAETCDVFNKWASLHAILERHGCTLDCSSGTTSLSPTDILDRTEAQHGHEAAVRLAGELLDYPLPSPNDAGDRLPMFGTIRGARIEGPTSTFELSDPFHSIPYYPLGHAERGSFYSSTELEQRKYWGPGTRPWVSRTESKIPLHSSSRSRWSVGQNFTFYARVSELLRHRAGCARLDPSAAGRLDEYTPIVFILGLESDGDIRVVEEPNLAKRKEQLGLDLDSGEEPDVIHTLLATRSSEVAYCPPHASYDATTSIALLYTGPEAPGPERYDVVIRHLSPERLCRSAPQQDPELLHFPPLQICAAWAVRWAPDGVVLIAACDGWEPSQALLDLAHARAVRMIMLPLSVIPQELTTRLRRRVFVSQSLRFHPGAQDLLKRLVEWRI